MTEFVDTHCHIQDAIKVDDDDLVVQKWQKAGIYDSRELIDEATRGGVTRLLCVGTTLASSKRAVALAQKDKHCFASIGIHPHEAKLYVNANHNHNNLFMEFSELISEDRVAAVGECGLDYYYMHSNKLEQETLLRRQIELALKHSKPLIFHVRDAFDDFWNIFDSYQGLRGVVHSFSATTKELDQVLSRGLYVGLNGIMTFTKNQAQLKAVKHAPLSKIVLETDAPFLTPVPSRGKICQPKHVVQVAEFLADLRGESLEQVANTTTANARELFGI